MIQRCGAERVREAVVAAWRSLGLGSSRMSLVLQGSRQLWEWPAAGLDVGGGPGSRGVVFVALGSPCVPSEGNLGARNRGKRLVRSSSVS